MSSATKPDNLRSYNRGIWHLDFIMTMTESETKLQNWTTPGNNNSSNESCWLTWSGSEAEEAFTPDRQTSLNHKKSNIFEKLKLKTFTHFTDNSLNSYWLNRTQKLKLFRIEYFKSLIFISCYLSWFLSQIVDCCNSAQGPCSDQEKVMTAVVKAVNAVTRAGIHFDIICSYRYIHSLWLTEHKHNHNHTYTNGQKNKITHI